MPVEHTLYKKKPTQLPPQKVVLTVSKSKDQMIELISEDLINNKDKLYGRLVITDSDPFPLEIKDNMIIQRPDITSWQEEMTL